jgi:hypothetical protein
MRSRMSARSSTGRSGADMDLRREKSEEGVRRLL